MTQLKETVHLQIIAEAVSNSWQCLRLALASSALNSIENLIVLARPNVPPRVVWLRLLLLPTYYASALVLNWRLAQL